MRELIWVGGGVSFIFLMTCLGSAMVFFLRNQPSRVGQTLFLGFAAGIMIAVSVFGLLIPAIEAATIDGQNGLIPATGGFAIGVLFLFGLDKLIPHLHPSSGVIEGISSSKNRSKRTTLIALAMTLHNIPEGIAVGLVFALAAQTGGELASHTAALALALGIGIQNIPEGAAVSVVFRQEGMSKMKSFLLGCATGIVEPIFGLLMIVLASFFLPIMPWLLAFAAGAMMYVVVEELIPEANLGEHSNIGTLAVMAGFLLMMMLEIVLS